MLKIITVGFYIVSNENYYLLWTTSNVKHKSNHPAEDIELYAKKVNEYDQKLPDSHNTDQHKTLCDRVIE